MSAALADRSSQARRAARVREVRLSEEPGWSYLLLSPFLCVYLVFIVLPILAGVWISFVKWDGIGEMRFVGLANYRALFANRHVVQSFINLFVFVAMQVPISVCAGLGLAIFIDRFAAPVATVLRAILLLPFIMPLFLTAAIWIWMLVPQFGLFNQLTSVFGLGGVGWLSNPRYMLLGLVIVGTWRSSEFNMLLFYAGLKSIPTGESRGRPDRWRKPDPGDRLHHPAQLRSIAFVITVNALLGAFQIFDLPWLLSKSEFVEGQGGAGGGLLFPVMESVASGFGSLRFGQGAAIGVLLMLLIFVATAFLFAGRRLLTRGG